MRSRGSLLKKTFTYSVKWLTKFKRIIYQRSINLNVNVNKQKKTVSIHILVKQKEVFLINKSDETQSLFHNIRTEYTCIPGHDTVR